MNRAFRLQGLLNLRRLQEEQAVGRLAVANAQLSQADASLKASRESLGAATLDEVASAQAMALAAAQRQGAHMQIEERQAQRAYAQEIVGMRQSEWTESRKKAATLEKLENKHAAAVTAENLAKEQLILDEMATLRAVKDAASKESGSLGGEL